nr:protein kinase-like domain-containing protein [Tanacetum cinerariifolium]
MVGLTVLSSTVVFFLNDWIPFDCCARLGLRLTQYILCFLIISQLIGVEIISLKDIKAATNCFSEESVIGKGSSGKIYKGELSPFKRSMPVAVKQLDKVVSYGEGAFLKEVVKLYHYSHENIIKIRGFCEEDNEKIIIMDHASNASLDRHLDKSSLTWGIRLKISIGAAKGLNHIHSFKEDQKTLHGKLAIEKAEKYSHHTLRQIINDERERYAGDEAEDTKVVFLAWMAARCFEENKLEALIFDDLKEQTDELEKALNIHEEWECEQKLPGDYERIMKMIENPESQIITKKDLYSLLSSGTRLNNGEVFLSLGIIYGAYLVFKFCDTAVSSEPFVKLEYSIANEDLNSYVAERRDDGWIMIELCRFRNHNQITEFKVQLERFWGNPCGSGPIFVDGIEFRHIVNFRRGETAIFIVDIIILEVTRDKKKNTGRDISPQKGEVGRIKHKKGRQVDNQEKLMFTRHENRGKNFRGCGRGKHKFSHNNNREKFREETKDGETSQNKFNNNNFKKSSYDPNKTQCYRRKKFGHIAPNCPKKTKKHEQSNLVEEDLKPTLLMAVLEDLEQMKEVEDQKVSLHEEDVGYKETSKESLWYLDNGASNHMTGVREHFKELDEKVSGKVKLGDGSYIEIKGKGSILLECDDE